MKRLLLALPIVVAACDPDCGPFDPEPPVLVESGRYEPLTPGSLELVWPVPEGAMELEVTIDVDAATLQARYVVDGQEHVQHWRLEDPRLTLP